MSTFFDYANYDGLGLADLVGFPQIPTGDYGLLIVATPK